VANVFEIATNFNFQTFSSSFMQVAYDANSLIVQQSVQMVACQDSVKIKQFATRTQTISGFSNFVFTMAYGIGWDFVKQYVTFIPQTP